MYVGIADLAEYFDIFASYPSAVRRAGKISKYYDKLEIPTIYPPYNVAITAIIQKSLHKLYDGVLIKSPRPGRGDTKSQRRTKQTVIQRLCIHK